ncbi:deoxyguanosinetriphosphate triphosphohydrolase family protein [Deinococcus daejeonensis]|uniref:HD domain-containing protein n=1 Tax=Deinococcus daejeonensis TaxID=1007098 RepID=A0ABQ2J7X4_9DEIO|nr:dNTP triphosphohydrolase [Deinococcus daejeonensis]GGN42081.1 hypothetical protein GCM10010842_28330 [Deinococcus daejeonensis]
MRNLIEVGSPSFREATFADSESKKSDDIPAYAVRSRGERDRDRVLYSSALRRLGGVTQVVKAEEADIYHNRLTHTFEVSQIGRRMAQYLKRKLEAENMHQHAHLCDPDIVEAACLAHDLGHPPFGHVAEYELNRLAIHHGNDEGFEGNAQSFRIVTRLARYSDGEDTGLNLSRSTLNAVLKYPWLRDLTKRDADKYKKFGAYRDDIAAFHFAREGFDDNERSFEAQIMDHADAIAYAVHDLSDFYKAGILDFSKMLNDQDYFQRYWDKNHRKLIKLDGYTDDNPYIGNHDAAKQHILEVVLQLLPSGNYGSGKKDEISQITTDSTMINYLVNGSLNIVARDNSIHLKPRPEILLAINFLKGMIWDFVIMRPQLATQQQGQIRIIKTLFKFYFYALERREYRMLPREYSDEVDSGILDELTRSERVRMAVDLVARLSEAQAHVMFSRIQGNNTGILTQYM